MTVFLSNKDIEYYSAAAKIHGNMSPDFESFNNGAKVVPIICNCGKVFTKKRGEVLNSIRYLQKTGKPLNMFCSPPCKEKFEEIRILNMYGDRRCPQCGSSIRKDSKMPRKNYCSLDCYYKHRYPQLGDAAASPQAERVLKFPPQLQSPCVDCDAIRRGDLSITLTCITCQHTHQTSLPSAAKIVTSDNPLWFCTHKCKNLHKYQQLLKHVLPAIDLEEYYNSMTTNSLCSYTCQKCLKKYFVSARQIRRKVQLAGCLSDIVCPECSSPPRSVCKRVRSSSKDKYKKIRSEVGKCVCGVDSLWLLVIHHKDGNRKNNSPENLEVLCHNCHASRHLEKLEGSWKFNSNCLTPREEIPSW